MKLRSAVVFLTLSAMTLSGLAENLYPRSNFQAVTADARPRRVGDLITVLVVENASASSTANTSAGRDATASFAFKGSGNGHVGSIGTGNQLDGRGRTERGGQVLAQLSVPITSITPEGDFFISGQQLLVVNSERQQITLEGRVRQQDISDSNVVLSSRIGNAKISYMGQGDLADTQRPAWWQRFLMTFGIL